MQQNILSLTQTMPNTFLMAVHMMKQNTPRYVAHFAYQNKRFSPPTSSRFYFQSSQESPTSREPYNNTQSGLSNSNGTIITEEEKTYSSL